MTFLLIVLKVMWVAHFDQSVALALVPMANAPSVLLTVALSLSPLIALWVAVAAYTFHLTRKRDEPTYGALAIGVIAAAVTLVSAPWVVVAMTATLVLIDLALSRVQRRPLVGRYTMLGDWPWVVLFLLSFVLTAQPWVPVEQVTLAGQPAFPGYVVDLSGGWATVLRDEDRSVAIVPAGQLVGRGLCRLGSWEPDTLADVLRFGARPEVPACVTPP
jgi:hypothetical protein